MSESIVRKIQPFTIGTKLSVPAVPKYSDVTEDNMSNRSLDNCKLQHNLNDKVSLYLDQPQMCVSERHCAPVMTQDTLEKRCQEEMVKEDHLNRNIASPTATSRAIRKITISSSVETTKETEILRAKQREMKINPNSENINNNNNITTDSAQLPRIVGVSCEKKPSSHFKVPVLLHRDSNNEPSSSNEQTSGFLLNLERCLDVQQTPVLQSQSLKNDLVKGNSSPCRQNEVSMVSKVLSVQKDYFFTQQNALFSKEISQAEAWIQEKLKKLKDIQTCSMMDWEEVTQTLQRDLKDFENTLIQLNQMGEQLMCKLNPTSDMVRKQLSQLRDQWNTLKQTAANQTRVISGFQSLHEFNKKVDKLEAWIKQKEEEPSLASPLGENNDKLQLTRQLLDLKQDKQLYRNLHEEINQLALKLEKQGKGEGKNISTRRKHINKMWLKIQSHLKDCQDNLQLALEASTFFQQADNFIASVNNMRKALSVTNQATFSGDGEILDIASQIMVLDVTVSQLSNLHPALAARVAEKQAKVKDSWLLLQSTVRNVKTEPLTSVCFVTGEDSDLSISNKELFSSMGMDQHRIMGKEVKDEQNRLKGTTGGRSLDLTRKPLDSHQEPLPNPVVSVGNTCTSEVSTKFQDQSKSGAMPKTHSHPHLHEQLEKFTVSADKTLSWLKDSVTMATHICSSGGGPSSYEAAKRYQASLEQDILSNKARIELVKKEGHSLVRAHHPGSAKIQDFLSQLEVLWEELKKRHQRNGMILRGSEELNYRAVKLLQGLGSLEAWLEAVELSIRQASLAGDPESVSVAERESRLLERELETHNLDLHNLKQELEALQSQRHLHTQLLPSRMEQVERKFRSIQMALTQQSSELKDTRMLTEFLERVELEENHYGSVGQPLQSDLDCASPLLPLRESRNSKPLIESLGDPVEELREAVEMLNDTARERSRSQSHDQCIQELISRHSIVVARVEQCLQRCTELAVDVLDMESEMAVRCEPEHCGMDSLQEQQDQLEADFAGLKEKVDAMDNLSARLLDLCPERVHTLGNKVQSSLQAWGELAKSIAENRSRLLQFGHLRHFFRKYLAMISWTEDTRSRIFSESALHHENQGSLVELLDKQIEQKFQEFDILASAGKKLLNEDHHLAKMIKERMEELRSMLGWILVHWRAQKIQWLNRKRAEEPHNDAIYSEATICSLLPELESETSSEDQLKTQGPVTVSLSGLEDNVQQDNGYELMESVTLKDSKTQSGSEELDSPYLVLKEPSTPSLGGTVNLILSFGNSGDSQLQVEESDTEKAEQFSEAVHRPTVPHSSVYKSFWKRCQGLFGSLKRKKKVYQQSAEEVSTYLKLKDTVPPVAPVYESMTLPQPHGIMQIPASSCPFTSLYLSSSPDMDCTTIHSLPMSSANSIFSNLKSKSIKRKKKKGIHRHTVQKIMGVEPSEKASSTMHEHVMYNMHTWPLKEKKKRKSGRKSDCKETQLLGYVKNPLAKHIDAECPRGLPGPLMELPTTATTDYVKNHCRFLSLGSVLSFDLPTDMSLIPSIQDIITIGSADSRKAAPPNKDSHTEHYTALSTFKLARSQPTHKNNESKRSPPGEINLKTDFQDNQRIHKDAISVSHKDFPFHHLSAEHSSKESLILSLSKPTSDHQTADNPAFNKGNSQQSEESISARNHCQNSTAEIHSYPNVHTLIQEFNGHQYHKAKPTCSQPRRESPVVSQSHASHIVLNFTSNGRQDLVDSRHSNSGSFKLCTEDSYFDTLEFPAPRRAVGKLFSLELESHKNMECLKIEPTNLPEDDPVHPDHQQFEQEEEELEDIWNQTNSYRQSICSDIMYQNSEAEPTICSSDHQREPSPKEVVLVRHLISASTPNLLGAEFRLPSSHTLMGYGKDCNIREEGHVLAKRERRSWAAFPQQDQSSKEGVLINETASDSVTLPEIEDQQKYIYKYREEEEEEEDTGGMKGHSLNFLSVHIDLEGAGPDSDTLVHSPTTRGHSSLVSGRREFPSMEGTLERKHKLLVGGRMALCRTWSSYHAVLYRQTLCFYHDRKDTISNSVISFPINLNGAECVQAPEYTKKPNCFSLRLCDGSEYLFSAPSHFMMKKWILQIQANTESSESEANINTSCGPAAQSVFPRSVSSPVRCQCEALCQCSMKGEESLNLPSCRQLGSARTKQIIFLEQDSSNIPQQHCEKMEELSSTLYSHASHYDSLGDLPDQKLHSQSFRGLSYSLCPSQDCSTSKKRSHSFTSATYQRIKPVRLPPKGRGQDSNSSYSVTLFIGDGEKPSVCSSTALLQPISSRQKSPELPHMSYASLPQSQSKSVFRKFFGKKD
ncbi:uncharacterized protein LOC113588398 isoform X2 [Electrophorus electricus]|uniref:uncharacterized protein LOC113588398 isoform X2 n=1 Tax=Electrophorus electricus TaxID=8005 RepID=UPI0015CFDF36|nr:uncharacterized protein LOC113588398 isoform X2 [Electrophorus electricus]